MPRTRRVEPKINHRDFAILSLVASGVTKGPELKEGMVDLIPPGSLAPTFSVYSLRLRAKKYLRGHRKKRNGPMTWSITDKGRRAVKSAREFYNSFQ